MNPILAARLLSDEYNVKIISATAIKPCSTQELSIMFDIPIAAAYRRVSELEKLGVLKCVEKVLTMDNKRIRMYKCYIENLEISYRKGKMEARITTSNSKEPISAALNVLARK